MAFQDPKFNMYRLRYLAIGKGCSQCLGDEFPTEGLRKF